MRIKLVVLVFVTIILFVVFSIPVAPAVNLVPRIDPLVATTCYTGTKRDKTHGTDSCLGAGTGPPGNTGIVITVNDSEENNSTTGKDSKSLNNLVALNPSLDINGTPDHLTVAEMMSTSMPAAAPPSCC